MRKRKDKMNLYKKIIAGITGIFIGAVQIISVNAATDDVSASAEMYGK